MVKEKGVRTLLEAYSRLSGKKPELVVIGDLDVNEYAKETVKEYDSLAAFKAFMSKEKVFQHIGDSLFVVIPSVCYDNLPNALLEAFAHGKAVIASGHGSFPDFIEEGKTGLLFEPGNVGSLEEKLKWAIAHPRQMVEMGKRARAYVEQEHAPEVHKERLMDLFQSLIKENRKQGKMSPC